ncbi:hypothetical protein BX666DRAFT_1950303 [Dichotomocladium elegans]|nr:hypothetical protein BX666DRAFT_1950303 [Dichotomocladium elegans]
MNAKSFYDLMYEILFSENEVLKSRVCFKHRQSFAELNYWNNESKQNNQVDPKGTVRFSFGLAKNRFTK